VKVLKYAFGEAGSCEDFGHVFDNGRGLRGRFEDDGIAGKESGKKGVDENEVGILEGLSGG
jgi:hypothetical protein